MRDGRQPRDSIVIYLSCTVSCQYRSITLWLPTLYHTAPHSVVHSPSQVSYSPGIPYSSNTPQKLYKPTCMRVDIVWLRTLSHQNLTVNIIRHLQTSFYIRLYHPHLQVVTTLAHDVCSPGIHQQEQVLSREFQQGWSGNPTVKGLHCQYVSYANSGRFLPNEWYHRQWSVTCIDARVEWAKSWSPSFITLSFSRTHRPASQLGIGLGEAHAIRNAGGSTHVLDTSFFRLTYLYFSLQCGCLTLHHHFATAPWNTGDSRRSSYRLV